MSLVATDLSVQSTSAAGAMGRLRQPMLIGVMLAGLSSSTASAMPQPIGLPPALAQTSPGATLILTERAGAAIAELRRVSGFTWDQLARLFDVSRRSLHFWATGKAMTAGNEEHLQRLLATVRKVDRGSARANRAALLAVRDDGTIPFDLLRAHEYERVVALLGPGRSARIKTARAADAGTRAPRPPEELVGALQERVHHERGAARVAKSVRARGRGERGE